MKTFGVRFWTGDEMIYPQIFTIKMSDDLKSMNCRTYRKDIRKQPYDSDMIMLMTSGVDFTGMLPIYEYDYLQFENGDIGFAEYDENEGGFVCHTASGIIKIATNMPHCEIIGNILENPEFSKSCFKPTDEIYKKYANPDNKEPLKEEKAVSSNEEKQNDDTSETKENSIQNNDDESIDVSTKDVANTDDIVSEKEETDKKAINPVAPSIELGCGVSIEASLIEKDVKKEIKDEEPAEKTTSEQETTEPAGKQTEEQNKDDDTEVSPYVIENKSEKPKNVDLYIVSMCNKRGVGEYCYTMNVNGFSDTYKAKETDIDEKTIDLLSVIAALNMMNGNLNIHIHNTKMYCIAPFNKGWIEKWKDNGWKKGEGEPLKSAALWKELYGLTKKFNSVKWSYIDMKNDNPPKEIEICLNIVKKDIENI